MSEPAPAADAVSLSDRAQQPLVFLLMCVLSAMLIIQCWRAPFMGYDDPLHIVEHTSVQAESLSLLELLTPVPKQTYFPVTILSYRIDRALFESWMPAKYGTWAPGARILNALYHAIAAWILWRLMLAFRLSRGAALFVACAFAAHPTACESVAWLSERKNVLASLFSFWAMLAWVKGEEKIWRVPATLLLWLPGLCSNPNALGMLPIFAVYDLMGGVRGLNGEAPMRWNDTREYIGLFERLFLLIVAAGLIIRINVIGFAHTTMPPPGGSIFTALLTDLEIVSKYLFNALVPAWISAAYCIVPVTSLADPRAWMYGGALLAAFAGTLYFASNRRLAFFAWIWIVGALGTHLNFKSIAFLMQDRYFYLSLPGVFVLAVLVSRGLWLRSKQPLRQLIFAGTALVCIYAMMAAGRSYTWNNMFTVFTDAAAKQPKSGFAQYGVAQAYRTLLALEEMRPNPDPVMVDGYRGFWLLHLSNAVNACPDARRIPAYLEILNQLGDIACERGDFATGEKYFQRAVQSHPDMQQDESRRASAMHGIGMIRLRDGKLDEALDWLNRAEALHSHDGIFTDRPRILLAMAQRLRAAGQDTAFALERAKEDLSKVAPESSSYEAAKKLMEEVRKFEQAPKAEP